MKAVDSPRFAEVAAWVELHLTADGFFYVEEERSHIAGAFVWTLRREGESWHVHVEVTVSAVRSDELPHLLHEGEHWVPRLRRGEIAGITIRSSGVELRANPGDW